MNQQRPTNGHPGTIVYISLLLAVLMAVAVWGLPTAPSITFNDTGSAPNATPPNRTDAGGTITTLVLDANQQNPNWKGYVGNVTGSYTLDDVSGNTLYDWSIAGTISGEIYASRNDSVSWTTVNCTNETIITTEEGQLNILTADSDSINSTFNATFHDSFLVGTRNMTNNSCRSTATYLNDTMQVYDENTSFVEVLLTDDAGKLVYVSVLEDNFLGFDNSSLFDFQIIVPEDGENPNPSAYYFWVEI